MKKIIPCIIATVTVCLVLFGCRADSEHDDIARTEYLTGVFTGTKYDIPDGYGFLSDFPVTYDSETRETSFCARKFEYEVNGSEDDTSAYTYHIDNAIFTFDENGAEIDRFTFPVSENTQIIGGAITDDTIYFFSVVWNETRVVYLNSLDRESGEITRQIRTDEADGIRKNTSPNMCAADKDGNLYIHIENKIVILDSDFVYQNTVKAPNTVSSMLCMSDGSVYVCTNLDGKRVIALVDTASGSLKPAITIDKTATTVSAGNGEYDFYYATLNGVYGAKYSEDGGLTTTYIIDNTNSGLYSPISVNTNVNDGSSSFVTMLDTETAIYAKAARTDIGIILTPMLYKKSPDIPVSDITVIELAYAVPLEALFREQIIGFMEDNPTVRVRLLDYTDNENSEDGIKRLLTDIQTGLIAPDIVYDSLNSSDIDASVIFTLAKKEQFTDLTPYLANNEDKNVNLDNLFGAVKSAFSTDDGKIWGIAPFFSLDAYISKSEYGLNYDTLEEFLDIAESFSRDVYLTNNCTQNNLGAGIWNSYTDFIDFESKTCSFDSDLFLRYLEYIMSLPTEEEYKKIPNIGEAEHEDILAMYRDGTFRLCGMGIGSTEIFKTVRQVMGDSDFCIMGNPAIAGDCGNFSANYGFMITSFAKDPDICFDLTARFMNVTSDLLTWKQSVGIPALKSLFDAETYALQNHTVIALYSDYTFAIYPNVEDLSNIPDKVFEFFDRNASMRGTEYRLITVDDKSIATVRDYLEANSQMLLSRTPSAISEIITEEISYLTGGVGSTADCAAKIQSRVSIWLAEH